MFPGDTKLKQRSGQGIGSAWQTTNRNAGAQQHTTAEAIAAQDAAQSQRHRHLMSAVNGAVRLRVKDDLGACLSCVAWDGTTEGTAIYVAKDTTMQNTISSYVKNSITYTCSYTLTADSGSSGMHYLARAVSGSDGSSETDDIDPPYILNTEIWAFPIPVQTLSSQSCQLMDSNAGGRAWASR